MSGCFEETIASVNLRLKKSQMHTLANGCFRACIVTKSIFSSKGVLKKQSPIWTTYFKDNSNFFMQKNAYVFFVRVSCARDIGSAYLVEYLLEDFRPLSVRSGAYVSSAKLFIDFCLLWLPNNQIVFELVATVYLGWRDARHLGNGGWSNRDREAPPGTRMRFIATRRGTVPCMS